MKYYVSTLPAALPSGEDLAARSQLLKERRVNYSCLMTWVKDCGNLPLLWVPKAIALTPEEETLLELRPATPEEVARAREPWH